MPGVSAPCAFHSHAGLRTQFVGDPFWGNRSRARGGYAYGSCLAAGVFYPSSHSLLSFLVTLNASSTTISSKLSTRARSALSWLSFRARFSLRSIRLSTLRTPDPRQRRPCLLPQRHRHLGPYCSNLTQHLRRARLDVGRCYVLARKRWTTCGLSGENLQPAVTHHPEQGVVEHAFPSPNGMPSVLGFRGRRAIAHEGKIGGLNGPETENRLHPILMVTAISAAPHVAIVDDLQRSQSRRILHFPSLSSLSKTRPTARSIDSTMAA